MSRDAVWARWARVGVAALVLGVHLDGCASTGALPEVADPRGAHRNDEDFQLVRVSPGTHMKFMLRDGSEVSGKYFGIERIPDAAYRERAELFRLARGDSLPPLPAPGSDILVHLSSSKSKPARLRAYGYRTLEVLWN